MKSYVGVGREGRFLASRKRPGSKTKLDERARRLLATDLEENPFAPLSDRGRYLKEFTGVFSVGDSKVCREVKRMAHSREKGPWRPARGTSS